MLSLLATACGGGEEPEIPATEDTGGGGADTGTTSVDSATADSGSAEDSAVADSGVVADSSVVDSTTSDSSVVDSTVADTTVADTYVPDTFVADTYVPDTFVADTYVPDTFVADTYVPDTFVADTYVPDTFVADTYVPDTFDACDDKNPCTTDSVGSGGACVHTALSGTACDDGDACNGAVDVCVAGVCRGQPKTVRDDFSGTALDPAKWTTASGVGTVTVASGAALLNNRGYLVSAQQFDPKKGPVRVTLQLKSTLSGDFVQVVVRSDGTPQGAYGEIKNGVSCVLGIDGSLFVGQNVAGAGSVLATTTSKLALTVGAQVLLEVFDDGTDVTCTARLETDKARVTVKGTPTATFTENRLTVYNREYASGDHKTYLDNITIERGVPVRPYAQWQFEETSGTAALDWAADADAVLGADATRTTGVLGTNVTTSGTATGVADFGATLGAMGTSDFTIAFWTKGAAPSATRDFLGNRDSSSGGKYFGTRVGSTGLLGIEMYGGPSVGGGALGVTAPVLDNTWHHVVLQRKGASLAAWVDGVAAGTATVSGVPDVSSTRGFMFGRSPFTDVFANYIAASLDDLRLYRSAIDECAVKNIYGK